MKKFVALIIGLMGLMGAMAAWHVIRFVSTPAESDRREVIFEIPNGTPFAKVSRDLETQGLIRDSVKFSWLAKFLGQTTRIKVGEYRLATDMRPRDVLEVITSGHSVTYPLTVPEGQNIFEIRDQLNAMWTGRGDDFFRVATDPSFIRQLTGENMSSLEGYLFPETYNLSKYTSTEMLIRKMYEYFKRNLTEVNKSQKLQMRVRDQVTLASVIEKETGAPDERPLISSVFHNRLKKGMRLQSDPTILYGILVEKKSQVKNITKADITKPTPYNTYTVKALPAGPIANPGREALSAAVNPVESNYLYFVSRNDGTHVFSESYEKHNKAVKTFQLNRKMREGRSWRDLKKKNSKN